MKLKYVIIVLIALLSCSSCNDWLDVVPQGQVQGDALRDGVIVRDDGRAGSILGFVHEDEESLL